MKFLSNICFVLLLFSLISCSMLSKNNHMRQEVQQCVSQCVQRFEICKPLCINNCYNCSMIANKRAAFNYAKYLHEQKVQGGINARSLKSYRDPLQCRKVTCNCSADFVACKENCTGITHKRLEAVSNCT